MDDAFKKMAQQFESLLDEMLCGKSFRSSAPDSWTPPVNVYELSDRLMVCVDLAGMQRDQIDVYVEDKVLHVRGVRPKPPVPEAGGPVGVHVMEIDSGKFHRKIPVSAEVRVSAIRARYRNGYLWIELPREKR